MAKKTAAVPASAAETSEETKTSSAGTQASPSTAAPTAGTRPSNKGRPRNDWIEGLGPKVFKEYREKFQISSEKAMADYLGVSIGTFRNWLAEKNRPDEAKQQRYKELLSKDYVAPTGGNKNPRGRPKKAAPPASAQTPSDSAAHGAAPAAGSFKSGEQDAVALLVLEYMRRLPSNQPLTLEQIEDAFVRIKRLRG